MGKIEKEYGMTEAELRRLLKKGNKKPKVIKKHITEDEYKIGIVSDTHLGSTDEALDELHTMYEIFRKVGIKEVLHAGDIVQGQKMFPGWEMETNVFGAVNQVKHCINNYPKVSGIKTYFITGN